MANDNKYASVQDVKDRYSAEFLKRVTNFTGVDPGTAIIDSRIEKAVLDASDQMDGFLQGRYNTPVEDPPDHFIPDCVKIAVKLLIERKGYEPDSADGEFIKAGNEVLRKYEKIAQGDISLGIPGAGDTTTTPTRIKSSAPAKQFSEETLDKY